MATSLADTSGLYGRRVIDVTSIIEHATRRCGVSASVLTAEMQDSARDNLFFILSNLATKGLSLWCVQRLTLGLLQGQANYSLPVGTIDLLNVLQRQATLNAATAVGAGVVSIALAEALEIQSALVVPAAAGTYTLVLEHSPDGVGSWVEVGRASVEYIDAPVGVDATVASTKAFWRVRDVEDPTRLLLSGSFLSAIRDVPMASISRDNYAEMPDKLRQAGDPTQYWYDKKFYRPQMVLWPTPNANMACHIFLQRHIQDPGRYTNAVEVPQRWLDTVIALLAPRVFLELPKELVRDDSRLQELKQDAADKLRDAEDSETDGAPITVAPNIGCYTK